MDKKKKIGIGISDFRKLIETDCLFIDKSLLIKEIMDTGAEVLLIPRPRRFGKTLNLSMIRYFLERCNKRHERERHLKLFGSLAIRDTEEFEKHFAKYPVVFLTFKDVKETDLQDALSALKRILKREIKRHTEEIPQPQLLPEELSEILHGSDDTGLYRESLQTLSELLHNVYGMPPVILIDEYDTPIHAAWQHGYYEDMVSFMRGLLSGAFKDNRHLFKGIITGILRLAKESIFSDLNNLDIYTILEEPFSDRFGLTSDEIKALFSEYGLKHRIKEADSWYNGYRFGSNIIFNPWSVLNFVNQNPEHPEPYWANTSANTLIKDLIVEGGIEVRENVERLITGKTIDSVIDKNIVFPDVHKKIRYLYSLFFFSGYLKCAETRMEEDTLVCTLTIPNREVRYIFRNIIAGWLEESFENAKLTAMLKALVNGNIDQFERLLNEFVITTLSFFDAKGKNPEAVFQAFILGMLLNLGREYEISSNRELGYGRYDVLVLPTKHRESPVIIMEMKSIAGFYQEEPEKAIEDTVRQVQERGYTLELEAKGYKNILKIVVVSDGKKVWVKKVE